VIVRSAENWNSTRIGAAAREWNDVVDDVAVRVDVVGDLRVAVRPVLRLPDDLTVTSASIVPSVVESVDESPGLSVDSLPTRS
jgi:hypothetical protein